MIENKEKYNFTGLEIAVIGMAGRFPGAKNINEYWENLKNGVDSISRYSEEELEKSGFSPELLKNPKFVKAFSVIEDKEYFDSSFFGYSPREAEIMDPQLRILYECSWHALEDAGYNPFAYDGAIGVYAGATNSFEWQALSTMAGKGENLSPFARVQMNNSYLLSLRISHKLDLRGPSYTVFSACSTSLLTVHLAYRALLTGECSMALAGGVTVRPQLKCGYMYEEGMLLSPDGHCRAFDAKARGTVFGEGVGIVVLKRAKEAIADKDHIYALIKGTAINNDGQSKVEFTAPSVKGQLRVIRKAYTLAKVDPGSIGYVETHGTGTNLGDPIEISALIKAFNLDKRGCCAIGSVKTNIGHLDIAAGIASFIKAVLVLKHRLIPPSLHFENPNPEIDFENSPFYVNTRLKPWKNENYTLRDGICSFGFGGTNAHAILEEAPILQSAERTVHNTTEQTGPGADGNQLILLSAKNETALDKMTENLAHHLEKNPGINLADVVYTLQVGRKAFQHRKIMVCQDIAEAIGILSSPDSEEIRCALTIDDDPTVVFMFPGQGAQYVDMGLGLYRTEPVFRKEMERCFEILKPLMDQDVKEILYPSLVSPAATVSSVPSVTKNINQTEIAQPVLFIFEYALAKLLMEWGIKPAAMIGHSIGEYTAAHLAGVFSLEDALKIVVLRGRLMQKMPPGAMAAVSLPQQGLLPLLETNPDISLAAVNAPGFCVISGPAAAVETFVLQLVDKGYNCNPLHTSHAFHSPMMNPILEEFTQTVRQVQMKEPQIPYLSNLTGDWLSLQDLSDPGYWSGHLRKTVRFSTGLSRLFKENPRLFLEVGPGKTLSTFVNAHNEKKPGHKTINLTRHPKEDIPDHRYLLNKIGQLWLHGKKVHWPAFHADEQRFRVSLPPYPFNGQKYWIEQSEIQSFFKKKPKPSSKRKSHMADWFYIPIWEQAACDFTETAPAPGQTNWLVFVDERSIADRLLYRLKQTDTGGSINVICVKMGAEFKKVNNNKYIILPACPEHYDVLFKELKEDSRVPQKILHCWSVMEPGEKGNQLEADDEIREAGLYSLINIVRAMGKEQIYSQMQIDVLTAHMLDVLGDEELSPVKATLIGALKVIPQEYTNISCRCMDIVIPQQGSPQVQRLPDLLLGALTSDVSELLLALRGNRWWVKGLKPIHLDKKEEFSRRLKEEGVYLITGGLGGIGFTLAQHLALGLKARLILVGRSTFPGREQWDEWLTNHEQENEVSLKIQKIRNLEKTGASFMIFSADVTNPQQMQQAITSAVDRFGSIDGIFHTAGVIDYAGIIQNRTQEMTESGMAAKVKGTLVLESLFKNNPPDFLVLFSSVSNALYKGSVFGQLSYVAANEFLDSYAAYKVRQGDIFTVAINWTEWMEVGMVIDSFKKKHEGDQEKINKEIQNISPVALSPPEGVECLRRILNESFPVVTVYPMDLRRFIEKMHAKTEENTSPPDASTEMSPKVTYYERPSLTTKYLAPRNDIEEKLVNIFQLFLGIRPVGIHDDFFEMGGNSLTAVNLLSVIHKELNVHIPLLEIFNNPSISRLTRFIADAETHEFSPILPAEEKQFYPLSSSQKRLYLLAEMDAQGTTLNQLTKIPLRGDINPGKLEDISRNMIERHEILRTSIQVLSGEPFQIIHPSEQVPSPVESVKKINNLKNIWYELVEPIDLKKVPMFRIMPVKTESEKYLLFFDINHIIADGISIDIFITEFMKLYSGNELSPMEIQYKDFSEWENSEAGKKSLQEQEQYWLKEFSGEIQPLNLHYDFPQPAVMTFDGQKLNFEIGTDETSRLRVLAREQEVTIFMLLLAIFNIMLAKCSGQKEILVGTTVGNRSHTELQPLIGCFVNTLVIRSDVNGNQTFNTFLKEVKEKTLKAFENQGYPILELQDRLNLKIDPRSNFLVDVQFQYDKKEDTSPENKGVKRELKSKTPDLQNTSINIALMLRAIEMGDDLNLSFNFNLNLFKAKTIRNYSHYFKNIASSIIENPGRKIGEIKMETADKRQEIASGFSIDLEKEWDDQAG